MSRYINGKCKSSMAHANHPYYFSCGKVVYGNGNRSHQRAHGCRSLTWDQWRDVLDREAAMALERVLG